MCIRDRPDWVRILTWVILAVLGVQVVTTAIRAPGQPLESSMALVVGLCFICLLYTSRCV